MLYVDTEVNGVPLKAFVDSGAQMTIMSVACAERCGIMRLVDRRFSGTAKGVGTAKILGRVHQAPLKIGGAHLTAAVTVLERGDMEFLFGLDMLKRHQCSIDLMSNELKIGTTGSAVPFLSEGQLPMHLRGEEAEQEQWEPVPAEAAASTPATAPTPIAAHPPAPAAAPTAAAAAAAPTPTAAADGGLDEAAIATLVGLGFPREQALQALQSTGGNVDLAASLLFN
jgi:DNA damage-inducible protein 1